MGILRLRGMDEPRMRTVYLRWRNLAFVAVVAFLVLLLYTTFYRPRSSLSCFYGYWEDATMHHLDRYCNQLDLNVTGGEGDMQLRDMGYQLESVHVLVRHGDRYHLHDLPNYQNAPIKCRVSGELQHAVPDMKQYKRTMEATKSSGGRRSKQTFHGYDIYPNAQKCSPTNLTPEGAAQHVKNGKFLKQQYMDQWNLLDEENMWDQILVRCTTKTRTFQSAVALLFGMLTHFDLQRVNMESAHDNSMCMPDGKISCTCPAIADYYDVFSCNWRQRSPHMMVQPRVKQLYAHIAEVVGTGSNTLPPPSNIMDVTMIHFCHRQPLPYVRSQGKCIQPWAIRDLYDSVNDNGINQVSHPSLKKIVRLKLHALMYEIAYRMKNQIKSKTPLKFVLYSGHDSTVEPFASAMGFSTGVWSRYAARIALELYSRQEDGDKKAYIRVLFDGNQVTKDVSFCADHLSDTQWQLCPLQLFLDFVDEGNIKGLGDDTYTAACNNPIPYT